MIMVNWLLNERPFTPTEDLIVGVLDHLLMVSIVDAHIYFSFLLSIDVGFCLIISSETRVHLNPYFTRL